VKIFSLLSSVHMMSVQVKSHEITLEVLCMKQENTKDRITLEGKMALDPFDIERLFGLSRGVLANMRVKRIGPPYFKVGRRIFYKPDPFKKWFFSTPVLTKDAIDLDLNR
jgi:hypothetical protein